MADIYTNQQNEEHSKEVSDYYDEIILLALLFLRGELTRAQYTAMHIELTETSIINGVVMAGGALTAQAVLDMLKEQQTITRESTRKLANDLENGRYSPSDDRSEEKARGMLEDRLALWTFTMGGAYNIGIRTSPQERVISLQDAAFGLVAGVYEAVALYIWEYGLTEDHCVDCAFAESQPPQPMAYWDALAARGIYPNSRKLKCTGFYCDCGYKEVGYLLPDGTQVIL